MGKEVGEEGKGNGVGCSPEGQHIESFVTRFLSLAGGNLRKGLRGGGVQ